MKAFWTGLPGAMECQATSCRSDQAKIAVEVRTYRSRIRADDTAELQADGAPSSKSPKMATCLPRCRKSFVNHHCVVIPLQASGARPIPKGAGAGEVWEWVSGAWADQHTITETQMITRVVAFASALLIPVLAHASNPSVDLSVVVVPLTPPAVACGSPNADSGTDITVDYSQGCSVWNNQMYSGLSTVNALPGADGATTTNAQAIPIKLQRTFWMPHCWSTSSTTQVYYCSPANYGGDDLLDTIIANGSQPVLDLEVWPNIGGDWEAKCTVGNGEQIPCDANENIQVYVTGLTHIASKYPNIRYIEGAVNESDGGNWALSSVEEVSRRIAVAVNQVNTTLGSKHFLIGGPAYADCYGDILDYVNYMKANAPVFDFITYHGYYDTLTNCAVWVATTAGLQNYQEFVTEWGDYNGGLEGTQPEAAYVAADYYGILTHNLDNTIVGFPWERNVYLAFHGVDAQVGPEYNVDWMLSKHKATRISPSAVTGPASKFHPIATKDSTGVALSLSTFGSTGSFTVHLNNLPAAFQAATFTWQEYLTDSTHGNCYSNCAGNGAAPLVASGSNPAESSFNLAVAMNDPNAMLMLILTPAPAVKTSSVAQSAAEKRPGGVTAMPLTLVRRPVGRP